MPGIGTESVPVSGAPPAAPPRWAFQISDLLGGQILADLPFDNVSYNTPLNDAGTFSCSLVLDQRITAALDVRDLTTPVRRVWYALRDDVPMFGGIIWTSPYDAETKTIQVGGADFWSYFDVRKVVSTSVDNLPDDPEWISRLVFTLPSTDQNSHARALVSLAQGHPGGNILVDYDLRQSGIPRSGKWYGYDLSDTGEELRRLTGLVDGPDIRFIVLRDAAAPGGIRRRLLIGTPNLGQEGSEHVFEYGRNLYSYTWPRDGAGMATRSYALGDGVAEGMPISLAQDSTLYDNGWPVLEKETSYSTVREFGTLQEHAEADQAAARAPIVLPTLSLRPGSSPSLGEYNVGDDARLIIKDDYFGHDPGLDTLVRINDVKVNWSSAQGEQVTLVCAPLVEGVV